MVFISIDLNTGVSLYFVVIVYSEHTGLRTISSIKLVVFLLSLRSVVSHPNKLHAVFLKFNLLTRYVSVLAFR